MGGFVCLSCPGRPVLGPDAADEHDADGCDVRSLPPEHGQGAPETPPDAGHVETFRGRRVGRRRADY